MRTVFCFPIVLFLFGKIFKCLSCILFMKIEVNITKTRFFVLLGAVLLLAGIVFVIGQVPNNPGHPANQIDSGSMDAPLGVGPAALDFGEEFHVSSSGDTELVISSTNAPDDQEWHFQSRDDGTFHLHSVRPGNTVGGVMSFTPDGETKGIDLVAEGGSLQVRALPSAIVENSIRLSIAYSVPSLTCDETCEDDIGNGVCIGAFRWDTEENLPCFVTDGDFKYCACIDFERVPA